MLGCEQREEVYISLIVLRSVEGHDLSHPADCVAQSSDEWWKG